MIKLFSSFFHPIPSDYEEWLEKLAIKGWQPKKVNKWCSVFFSFEKKEPKKYRYVLDLQNSNEPDYIKMYEEFGWELYGKITNAYLWRMEYAESRPESFTDKQTLKERNIRFFKAISLSLIIQIIIQILITVLFILNFNLLGKSGLITYLVVLVVSYIYTIYLSVTTYKIKRKDI